MEKSRISLQLDIAGIDEIEMLLIEHKRITNDLEENVAKIRYALQAINLRIEENPSAATDG